ncbi:hypothetical protein F5X99DRAFT_414374 [Biscogniauxia marginata]|nr:hypothetical protein F5X99DRAFT_414374 [Biscogniauxia marginata]
MGKQAQEDAEDKTLLGTASDYQASRPRKKRSGFSRLNLTYCLSLNLVLTTFNLAILLCWSIFWWKSLAQHESGSSVSSTLSLLPPSPAISAIERELRPFTLSSPYNQHPGPRTDKLWHDLVNTEAVFPLTEEEFLEVNDSPETVHCVEMLRNAVMCFGDVSVITYNWKQGHEGPKASFKSMHSCRKWDKIEEWRSAHDVTGYSPRQ